jgi:16S rRNA (cytosine967-C5)-methyltransferase
VINTRIIVLHILETFDKQPWDIDNLIDRQLQKTPVDHRDRRFVFEMVYGIVRRRLTIDNAISHYLNDPELIENKHLKRLLEIGIYQLVFMDKVPDHAAVNETVECARQDFRSKKMTGLVNGVLRTLIKEKKRVDFHGENENIVTRLSIEYSHPEWMISRWLEFFGLAKTKKLLAFNNEKPGIFIRRKIHGLSRIQFENESRDFLSAASGYMNLYYLLGKPFMPESFELFEEGNCTVQAPSSGWVAAMLDVQQGDIILDLCAAPGGKSCLIGELTGTGGRVIACEIKDTRMKLVCDSIKRLRLTNVIPIRCDGKEPPFHGRFNKILLDAPCSGSGVLHRHPEARWIKKQDDIERLSLLQEKLLVSSSVMLAPGGILVYSTCSLEPEENEMRVDAFLASNPDFVLDAPPQAVPDKFIDPRGFLRITPYEHSLDGMFGARLKKR